MRSPPRSQTVAYLHDRGQTHGDLKPSNVVLGPDGRPHLIDFNLASGRGSRGVAGGTPAYMAPELLRALRGGPAPTDGPAADVYSFGVLAFEMLTGKLPWRPGGGHVPEVIAGELLAAGLRPCPVWPAGVPRVVRRLIDRCLADNPSDRPPAAECHRVLVGWLDATRGRWRRVHRMLAIPAAVAVMLLTAATVAWAREPHTADAYIARGMEYVRAKNYDAALEDFESACRLDPKPRSLSHRGSV